MTSTWPIDLGGEFLVRVAEDNRVDSREFRGDLSHHVFGRIFAVASESGMRGHHDQVGADVGESAPHRIDRA